MSRTKAQHPEPEDGKGKRHRKHAKHSRSNRDKHEQWDSANSRIYKEDFLPPRPWNGDA